VRERYLEAFDALQDEFLAERREAVAEERERASALLDAVKGLTAALRGGGRAGGGTEKGAGEGGDRSHRPPANRRKFLRVLHRVGAFDHGTRTTIGAVALDRDEPIGNSTSKHVLNAVDWLKEKGLIETAVGPNGGVWLTPKGRDHDPS